MVFMELLVLRGGEGRARPAGSHLRGGEARHGGGGLRKGGGQLPSPCIGIAAFPQPGKRSRSLGMRQAQHQQHHPPLEMHTEEGPSP